MKATGETTLDVRIAGLLYRIRERVKARLGDQYEADVREAGGILSGLMRSNGEDEFDALRRMASWHLYSHQNFRLLSVYAAAVVELTEGFLAEAGEPREAMR